MPIPRLNTAIAEASGQRAVVVDVGGVGNHRPAADGEGEQCLAGGRSQYREEVLREVGTVEFRGRTVSLRGAGLSGRPDRESDEQHDDAGYHHLVVASMPRLIPAATIRDVG